MSDLFETLGEFIEQQIEKADEKGTAELFKKATDSCMQWTKQSGYTPTNIEYLNGYYIFGFGTNSVIHYNIKECPEWNFGIWWSLEERKNNISSIRGKFFCEHKQNIDKFKPSCCENGCNILFNQTDFDKDAINWTFNYEYIKLLKFISKHPIRAFYRTYCGTDFNKEYVSGLNCLYKYFKFKLYRVTKNTWNKWFEISETKFIRKYVLPLCDWDSEYKAELHKMNEGYSPMYDIQCRIPDGADESCTGCFSIFEDNINNKIENKIKNKWDKLIKRHEKISDVFHFLADSICDDCVTFYRECDFKKE